MATVKMQEQNVMFYNWEYNIITQTHQAALPWNTLVWMQHI